MLAPTVFEQTNGLKIAVDAFDICLVSETESDGTQVTYMATDTADVFHTNEPFDDVLAKFKEARQKATPRSKPRDGDEWKYGYDEDDGP